MSQRSTKNNKPSKGKPIHEQNNKGSSLGIDWRIFGLLEVVSAVVFGWLAIWLTSSWIIAGLAVILVFFVTSAIIVVEKHWRVRWLFVTCLLIVADIALIAIFLPHEVTLKVNVTVSNSIPESAITIVIRSDKGAEYSVSTGADGVVVLEAIQEGNYTLSAEGFDSLTIEIPSYVERGLSNEYLATFSAVATDTPAPSLPTEEPISPTPTWTPTFTSTPTVTPSPTLTETPTITPSPTDVGCFPDGTCDIFPQGAQTGGAILGFSDPVGGLEISYSPSCAYSGTLGIKLAFNFPSNGLGLWGITWEFSTLGHVNPFVGNHERITFYARGTEGKGGETFQFGLEDSFGDQAWLYLPNTATLKYNEWLKITIHLQGSYFPTIALGELRKLFIGFSNRNGKGAICLDNFVFD